MQKWPGFIRADRLGRASLALGALFLALALWCSAHGTVAAAVRPDIEAQPVDLTPFLPGVQLAEVPRTGPVVTGAAALHEHVMAEHAFSGKWHWGSVDGAEETALGLCDGDGNTHAGAFDVCSEFAYVFGDARDALGRDTCCHTGILGACNYKATNGNDLDAGDQSWDYLDWPVWDTKAHPQYWHGHLQKALDAGLKLMVAHAVESYLFCSLVDKETFKGHPLRGGGYACDHGDSFNSITRQIEALKAFVANHADFLHIAYSPQQAREIIHSGKMAIVIGVEADYAWGNEKNPLDLLQRLNAYYAQGVRSIFLAHHLNTRLAGAALSKPEIGVFQSFANCFFLNKQCAKPYASAPYDPDHAYEVEQALGCLPLYAKDYSEMCARTFSRARSLEEWNGFNPFVYPGGGVYTEEEYNYPGDKVLVRKNSLGLTSDGAMVVNAMMHKGMLLEISHLSENAVAEMYNLSQQAYNYPLMASHGYARRMLFDTEEKTRIPRYFDPEIPLSPELQALKALLESQFPLEAKTYAFAGWEFALSDSTLEKIKATDGILGHFIAPDPAPTYAGSNVVNNCPRSTRSLAQLIAYAVDKGVRVAWAGDLMGMGSGVAPRRSYSHDAGDWCGGDTTYQAAQGGALNPHLDVIANATEAEKDAVYFGTRGFGHIGLLRAFHDDLAAIGVPVQILDEFKDHAAENCIRTWEKSEYIAQCKLGKGLCLSLAQ